MYVYVRAIHRAPESRRRLQGPGGEPMWVEWNGCKTGGRSGDPGTRSTHLQVQGLPTFNLYYHSGVLVDVKSHLGILVSRQVENFYCNVKSLDLF